MDSHDEENFIEQYSAIKTKCFVTVSSVVLTVCTKFLFQRMEECDCIIVKKPSPQKLVSFSQRGYIALSSIRFSTPAVNAFVAAQFAFTTQHCWSHDRRAVFHTNLSASSHDIDIVYIINTLRTFKRAGRETNARRRVGSGELSLIK